MNTLLRRFGIQPRIYFALVRSMLLMDLRGQHFGRATGVKPNETLTPLFWVIGQYLFISAILSGLLFARVDVWAFAFVGLVASMGLTAMAVVVEFNEVVFDPGERDILGPRPVPARTYAAARFTNLAFYVALVTLALNIFPAVVGAGLRDAGRWYLPVYAVTAVLGSAAVASAAILILSIRPPRQGRADLRDVLAWTQIIVAAVVFYGGQLMLRQKSTALVLLLDARPSWMRMLPPAWLADIVESAAVHASLHSLLMLLVAGAVTLSLCGAAVYRLAGLYQAQVAYGEVNRVEKTRQISTLVGPWLMRIAGSRQGAAVLCLALRLLRRDHELRMRAVPALTLVIAALVLGGFSGQLGNPYAAGEESAILSIVVIQLLVLAVPAFLDQMKSSRDHDAVWVLDTAPAPKLVYAEAARRAVCYAMTLPVLAILWLTFCLTWRAPLAATLHCTLAWLQILAASHLSLWGVGLRLPFSRPPARGTSMGPIAPFLAALSAIGLILAVVQYHATRFIPALAAYVVLLVVLWQAARRFVQSRALSRA
jgi:hypothetical protein